MKVPDFEQLDINNRPETYKTILKDKYGINTQTTKLRRKMNKLVNSGSICSKRLSIIDNGRDSLFFTIEKEYFIVYTKNKCYYCENIEQHHSYNYLILVKAYELNCVDWIRRGNVDIPVEEVKLCF